MEIKKILHNYLLTRKKQSVINWIIIFLITLGINKIFKNSAGIIEGITGVALPLILINIFIIAYKNKTNKFPTKWTIIIGAILILGIGMMLWLSLKP